MRLFRLAIGEPCRRKPAKIPGYCVRDLGELCCEKLLSALWEIAVSAPCCPTLLHPPVGRVWNIA